MIDPSIALGVCVYILVVFLVNFTTDFTMFKSSLDSFKTIHKIPKDVWSETSGLREFFRIIVAPIIIIWLVLWVLIKALLTGSIFAFLLFKQ